MIYTIDNPKKVMTYFGTELKNFTGVVKDQNGVVAYFDDGEWHREDGPAVIHPDGSFHYYIHDKSHREDGPSSVANNGIIQYRRNGLLHREDGPALINGHYHKYWLYGKPLDISTDAELKDSLILRMFE